MGPAAPASAAPAPPPLHTRRACACASRRVPGPARRAPGRARGRGPPAARAAPRSRRSKAPRGPRQRSEQRHAQRRGQRDPTRRRRKRTKRRARRACRRSRASSEAEAARTARGRGPAVQWSGWEARRDLMNKKKKYHEMNGAPRNIPRARSSPKVWTHQSFGGIHKSSALCAVGRRRVCSVCQQHLPHTHTQQEDVRDTSKCARKQATPTKQDNENTPHQRAHNAQEATPRTHLDAVVPAVSRGEHERRAARALRRLHARVDQRSAEARRQERNRRRAPVRRGRVHHGLSEAVGFVENRVPLGQQAFQSIQTPAHRSHEQRRETCPFCQGYGA